ncbi:MAG: dTDP-4-dehydrorhamnose reductase [Deltaproteobacteria bacterium]|nr:dTDP-4-dehydrorhamnose reductase [Deltaproteobacteria bacterium]
MKILLFGGSGQLGFEIQKRALDLNFEVVSPFTSEVNISEETQVLYLCSQTQPDVILNCAAYTAVDKAEEEKDLCFKINRDGARNVALGARQTGAKLIHISTDYVFDGEKGSPLTEDDPVNPLSVYGMSKLDGEREILKHYPDRTIIVRTSSLYGQKGVNFVRTMLDLFHSRDLVRVVNDQVASPTWAGWLAEALLDISRMEVTGVLHAACSGETSWFDFAKRILDWSSNLEPHPGLRLEPISAAELGRPARRPRYSVLDCGKLTDLLGRAPMHWEEGLKAHLREIGMLE